MTVFASTERLVLRAIRDSDVAPVMAIKNNLHLRQYTEVDFPVPVGPKGGKEFIENCDKLLFCAVIELKPSDGVPTKEHDDARWVGICSLGWSGSQKNRDAWFGISLRPEHWNKGYGTESLRWLLDWGFEQIGLHRISLDVFTNNAPAIALYKKVSV